MILQNLISTSIQLNGVIHPARNFDRVLAQYTRPLFVWSDHDIYKAFLRGSSTRLHYRNAYYLLCTRHQVKDLPLDDVAIMKDDGSYLITSAGVRHFIEKGDSDYSDLVAFDFTEPCQAHPDLIPSFFNFDRLPPDAPSEATVFVQLTGFPIQAQLYELEENHIGLQKHTVLCGLASQPSDDATIKLKAFQPVTFDSDGMSGGTAFTVQMIDGNAAAHFAGIILRGGTEHFYILKSGYIRRFLDMGIAEINHT